MVNSEKYIEVIYVSSNNNINSTNIKFIDKLTLKNVQELLISKKIFSKDFLEKRYFGCYGKLINSEYIIKENDRVEIFDNLRMSPNEKRKFNFKQH